MTRVLITGGAGQLGRLCVEEFGRQGYEITTADRVEPRAAEGGATHDHFVVDLTNPSDVDNLFATVKPEIVVHLAANRAASDHPTLRLPEPRGPRDDTFRSNVLATYYLLDAAVQHGVRRIVAAGSYYVTGVGFRISGKPYVPDYLPIDEAHPRRPEDSYSLSKVCNEEMYDAYSRAYGIEVVTLRLMRVYYPDATPEKMFLREPPASNGAVQDLFAYVDARDAALCFRLGAEADVEGSTSYFVASDRITSTSAQEWLADRNPALAGSFRGDGWRGSLVSIEKAREVLGYEPQHSWRDESPELAVDANDWDLLSIFEPAAS